MVSLAQRQHIKSSTRTRPQQQLRASGRPDERMDGKRINNAPNVFDDCKQNKSLCIRCSFHVSMQSVFSRWNFFSIVSVCRVGRHYVSRWPLLLVFLLLILDCLREIGNDRVDALRQANEWKKQDGKAEKHDEKRRNEVKPVRQHMLLPLPLPCGIKVKIVKENTNTVDGNGRIFRIK